MLVEPINVNVFMSLEEIKMEVNEDRMYLVIESIMKLCIRGESSADSTVACLHGFCA